MIMHYLKIAARNLVKNKVFSAINIAGLSLGLACCLLILLYTKDEISYDRFHENAGNIYQLVCDRVEKDGLDTKSAIAAMVQAPAFTSAIPEIKSFTRVDHKSLVAKKGNEIFSEDIFWVDNNFFTVFSFPLMSGNRLTALDGFNSMVITEAIAKKYFGTAAATGKTIQLQINGHFEPFVITAIAKKAPENSSIQFSILVPFRHLEQGSPDNGWMWFSFPSYFVLRPDANIKSVIAKMDKVFRQQAADEIDMNHLAGYDTKFIWGLVPFLKMHLNTDYAGTPGASTPVYSFLLTGIAAFILFIACVNFVNLSVAGSLRRSKEIGIRKVAGGLRSELIYQFMVESMLICMIAFITGIAIALLLLPFFNELAGKKLDISYLLDVKLTGAAVALYAVTFIAAGLYPAFILSGLKPIASLSGKIKSGSKNSLLKGMVVLQFSLATLLIITVLFMNAQFHLLTTTALGYNEKNLIEFVAESAVMNKSLMNTGKLAFSAVPGVEMVGYANIGKFGGKTIANKREFNAVYEHTDENYLPVLQATIVAGRNFSPAFSSDVQNAVLVNETFVHTAGWKDAIGKTIDYMNLPGWGSKKVIITGIIKDFHFESLREKIKPQVFTLEPQLPLGRFIARIKPSGIPATVSTLEKTYHSLFPDHPFQYSFREDILQNNYTAESKWKQVVGCSAIIAIFISCIGLFGLAVFATGRRTKEIGIRKVMGAGSLQLASMVSADFIKLVLIAFFIAIIPGYYIVNSWLQNFAVRVNTDWWMFATAAVITQATAIVTVGFHAFRAAQANPVKSLRN